MKKILHIISIVLLTIMILFTVNTSKTYAGRGCCSWHGGQDYCGSNGKWICQDGTESPSCTCSNNNSNYNKDSNIINNDNVLNLDEYNRLNPYYIDNLESTIEDLEEEKEELIEENKRLQTDKENLLTLLIILGIVFIVYIFYKKKEN